MIPKDFFLNDSVNYLAQKLIGMELITNFYNQKTSGIIAETEAYAGISDKASHAYGGKLTKRTETMYKGGGTCYVYLCYGIHPLFNIVTNIEGIPHAILIRAIEPLVGLDTMKERRKFPKNSVQLGNGPGILTKSLGINIKHNGLIINQSEIQIAQNEIYSNLEIIASPRIGAHYAKEDALLPYRYRLKGNPFCSPAV
jgi:DNA-3-methyladenine glycosylase